MRYETHQYLSRGFLPLQEFKNIDWDGPTLVLVKALESPKVELGSCRAEVIDL